MNNAQYESLTGTIEGLADTVAALAATLEIADLIDGPLFTDRLRQLSETRTIPDRPACTEAARAMLKGMAEQLDQMRAARQ